MIDDLAEATVEPDGDAWTLIFIRDLRHPPKAVWTALTDPAELERWAPFVPSRDLGTAGEVTVTTVDGDQREDGPAVVRRAEAPAVLEYSWGDNVLRWELEPVGDGTRLILRHTLQDPDVAQFAAGWHICVAQMARLLDGEDVRAVRGHEAMEHGWAELREAYAAMINR
jgi:uncharacterized protein YndB with AHSA1/START domain